MASLVLYFLILLGVFMDLLGYLSPTIIIVKVLVDVIVTIRIEKVEVL